MKNHYKLILLCSGAAIFLLSVALGVAITKNDRIVIPETTPSPTVSATTEEPSPEPVSAVFKIQLTGTTLEMFEGEKSIKKTEISPELYPVIDIDALSRGTEYVTYEDALMDWESLSE